jgi:hypothetical protein
MPTWVIVVLAVLYLVAWLLVISLCVTAGRSDRG